MISSCSDKLAVREFVQDRIGEAHLIPLLFHGPKLTPEELLALGDHLVVKANHDSGSVHIIDENSIERATAVVEQLSEALQVDYGAKTNQPAYSKIRPSIIVEQKLTDSGVLPIDYKVFCFGQPDGRVEIFVEVHFDRGTPNYCYTFYDSELNLIDLDGFDDVEFPIPEQWPEIMQLAKKVSDGFDFVRVDLYSIDSKIYFGEMTFFPSGGRWPYTRKEGSKNDFDLELGSLWSFQ